MITVSMLIQETSRVSTSGNHNHLFLQKQSHWLLAYLYSEVIEGRIAIVLKLTKAVPEIREPIGFGEESIWV